MWLRAVLLFMTVTLSRGLFESWLASTRTISNGACLRKGCESTRRPRATAPINQTVRGAAGVASELRPVRGGSELSDTQSSGNARF